MPAPEPTVRPVAYAVSCLPEDHVDARHLTLRVEYRRDGKWAVTDRFRFLSRTGTWSMGYSWRDGREPRTDADFVQVYAGREAWQDEHWHDLDTALALAKEHAPLMDINGHTVADVLARSNVLRRDAT